MLVVQPQNQIVEKVLKTKAGILVRATFLVSTRAGKAHVKLLSAVPVSAGFETPCAKALPCSIQKLQFELEKSFGEKPTESPFLDFSFFVSQPTRAPAK